MPLFPIASPPFQQAPLPYNLSSGRSVDLSVTVSFVALPTCDLRRPFLRESVTTPVSDTTPGTPWGFLPVDHFVECWGRGQQFFPSRVEGFCLHTRRKWHLRAVVELVGRKIVLVDGDATRRGLLAVTQAFVSPLSTVKIQTVVRPYSGTRPITPMRRGARLGSRFCVEIGPAYWSGQGEPTVQMSYP